MSVFAEKVLPIIVKAWTADFSTFEKNPEANGNRYRPAYFVPDEVEDEFRDYGLNISVSWNFAERVWQVVISEIEDSAWSPEYRLNDGDSFAINSGPTRRVIPKDA